MVTNYDDGGKRGPNVNQTGWEKAKESRLRIGMMDFLRKRISEEDYERIRNQTYEECREELGHGYEGEAATTIS